MAEATEIGGEREGEGVCQCDLSMRKSAMPCRLQRHGCRRGFSVCVAAAAAYAAATRLRLGSLADVPARGIKTGPGGDRVTTAGFFVCFVA